MHDYYLRVHDAFFEMCEAKPADMATLQVVPANIAALAVPMAAANDNIRADNHSRSSTVGSIVSGALNALNW